MVEVTSEPYSIVVKFCGVVGELTPTFVVFGAQSLWCKPPAKRRGLQLGCGDRPEQLSRFGDRPQGSLSGITTSCIVRGREEITVALAASWGALCLHTAPNGD